MKIIVLGAGMQGTLYGVRLAQAGHAVTLIARGHRAEELRRHGAIIEHVLTGRREQLESVIPALSGARGIGRAVFLVNHACGSASLFAAQGRHRTVLGFPGAAGSIENGVDQYIEVAPQPTALEASAPDVAKLFRGAGFRVSLVCDMDSWLRRHAVFVTAVSGALYQVGTDAGRLASDRQQVRNLIVAIREGWAAMDRQSIAPAPIALRAIFQWVPLPFAVRYWQRLLGSAQGEYYFARHTRQAAKEMAALAADVCALLPNEAMPQLRGLYAAVDRAAGSIP